MTSGPLQPGRVAESTGPAWQREFAGKTIVVTGAGGFLGGRLVARLAGTTCRILRVARTPQSTPPPAAGATVIDVEADLRHRAAWDGILADADVIFHLAAQTSAVAAAEDPESDFDANVAPMRHLLAACRQQRRRPMIVFAGTVTQAGIPARLPVNEDVPDNPVTAYDTHKLLAERDLEAAVAAETACGVTLRLVNVYGPRRHGPHRDRDVLNRMIRTALRGDTLTVFGSGDWVRDYLYVDDAVEAFLMAGAHAGRISGRHYVVGTGMGTTVRRAFELVAARVQSRTGRAVRVQTAEPPRPLTALERRNFVADSSRFSRDTGWLAAWTLSDGIDRAIEACTCE